jgi:hypothetical protein
MKWVLILGLIFCFSFVVAQDIHIDSSAGNGGDGSSSNPFNELADVDWNIVHDYIISGNDVHIKLKRGEIFQVPTGWAGWRWYAGGTPQNRIYLEGYGSGDMPIIESPFGSRCIFLSGSDRGRNSGYITFDGIEIRNGLSAIEGADMTHLVVKNCKIHDMKMSCIGTGHYAVIGGAPGEGNEIYDCGSGTGGCDVRVNSHDVVVSYNHLYATKNYSNESARGIDGLLVDSSGSMESRVYNILIEHNIIHDHNDGFNGNYDDHGLNGRGEDGIDVKNAHNVTIRYNDIYNHAVQSGITVQMNSWDVYIYGNRIHDNSWGNIMMMDGSVNSARHGDGASVHNVNVWGNVMYNADGSGINIAKKSTGDPVKDINIFNNVIALSAKNTTFDRNSGIYVQGGNSGIKIKNNIFYKNRPTKTDYRQIYIEGISGAELDGNHYYWPGKISKSWWGGVSYDSLGVPGQEGFGIDGNPLFVDADGYNFELLSSSSSIDSGLNLGVVFSKILSPLTNWDSLDVVVSNQNDFGSGWERGAYVYTTETAQIYSCTGLIPANAVSYDAEESLSLGGNIPWTYSATDSQVKCQYYCFVGIWNGSSCVVSNANSYSVLKTNFPVVVDGDLGEFSGAEKIVLTNSRGTTGVYKFMWDENYLYIAGNVSDEKLNSQKSVDESDLWNDDSIEIMFDTANNGGASMDSSNDYKFFVNSLGTITDTKKWDTGWNSGIEKIAVEVGTNNQNGDVDFGYVVEAMIPFSNWVKPKVDDVWGMNFILNDNYGTGLERMIWSGLGINVPDDAGKIVFVEGSNCVSFEDVALVIENWKGGGRSVNEILEVVGRWKRGC